MKQFVGSGIDMSVHVYCLHQQNKALKKQMINSLSSTTVRDDDPQIEQPQRGLF